MKMFQTKVFAAAIAASMSLAASAHAAITFSSTAGPDGALPAGYTMVYDYDGIAAPGYSQVGGNIGQPPLVFGVSAPPLGTAPGTNFAFVKTGESATLFTPLISKFSVYIGSVDSFNSLAFYSGVTLLNSFGGDDLAPPADGDQSSGATNRRYFFDFNGDTVDRVVFASSGNSMEWDSIATAAAIPEPATWAMMIGGFGLLGAAMRRRRHLGTVAAAA